MKLTFIRLFVLSCCLASPVLADQPSRMPADDPQVRSKAGNSELVDLEEPPAAKVQEPTKEATGNKILPPPASGSLPPVGPWCSCKPGKMVDPQQPFQFLPRQTVLQPPDSSRPTPSATNAPSLTTSEEQSFVFPTSAYFPQLAPEQAGCAIERDPVIIYEGMSIWYSKEGKYRVRFTVSIPNVKVRLRLQLSGIQSNCPIPLTITLPPIDLVPANNAPGTVASRTYQVVHEGYSDQIWRRFNQASPICFHREGTARFGSGVVNSPGN